VLTHPKSTMRILHMLMHLTSGQVTLLSEKFLPPELTSQSDLGRRADSRWALPQISSDYMNYTVSQKKNPDINDFNMKKNYQILIIFCTYISDITGQ